jgi:hypothetical protein
VQRSLVDEPMLKTNLGIGRKLFLLAVGAVCAVLLCGYLIQGDLAAAWRDLGVPSLRPSFADMRTITHSIECKRAGHDPYVFRECDPWKRLYNYPPIWLELGRFSIGSSSTNWLGGAVAAAFIITLVILNNLRTPLAAGIAVLASISPPVLFGLERGNTDLFIFSSICLMIYYTRSGSPYAWTGLIILTLLKLHPIAAVPYSLRFTTKEVLLISSVLAVSIIAVLLSSGGHLQDIAANTPTDNWRSYGSQAMVMYLNQPAAMIYPAQWDHTALFRVLLAFGTAGIGVLTVIISYRLPRKPRILPLPEIESNIGKVALACNLIFIFTFLTGTNYDYRLIFLLPGVLANLKAFENSFDRKNLWYPIFVAMYFWVTPLTQRANLGSALVHVISLSVFLIVFSAVTVHYVRIWTDLHSVPKIAI